MGADDANEGHGDGECVEHVWLFVRAVLDGKGSLRTFRCSRCRAEYVQGAAGDVSGRSLPGWDG